jgi:hypothetical protein
MTVVQLPGHSKNAIIENLYGNAHYGGFSVADPEI